MIDPYIQLAVGFGITVSSILVATHFSPFGGILVLIVIGIPILIIVEAIRRAHDYYITNKRIIYDFTFFSRKVSSVVYRKITDVHFTQNLFQRIFQIGDIQINTAGGESIEVKVKGIKNPGLITNFIQKHMIK